MERTQRGFFARLKLESFGPDAGVLPHERTLSGAQGGPLQAAPGDRREHQRRSSACSTTRAAGPTSGLRRLPRGPPDVDVTDDDGVRHRLWALPASGRWACQHRRRRPARSAAEAGPITIADGHHRYETALRYRDERRMTRSCEEDPPFDYLLALMLEASGQDLTVLPTHRLVRGIGDDAGGCVARARA